MLFMFGIGDDGRIGRNVGKLSRPRRRDERLEPAAVIGHQARAEPPAGTAAEPVMKYRVFFVIVSLLWIITDHGVKSSAKGYVCGS